ncbi:MFS transporter [Halomonas sp. PR-M31]|uniref:MFS transporter n=1 Tax=Halomonas sp. PR-M31 TaxID=1471202 RepID=UPI00069CC64D|nr:MFS transporter [Halomonas sp. PR-M31]
MRDLLILCFAYAISLFYRGMIAVIAPEISADLTIAESGLGLLSSTFFISFAVAQVPAGLALDRFGARLSIGLFMWLAVLGTVMFSMAESPSLAFVGQVLIGVGCAPIFTGTMLFIGRHYPPERFAYFTALVIAIGSTGDLLGTTPLAMATEWLGWRSALLLIMVLAALAASACLMGLKPDRPDSVNYSLTVMLQGMARVTTIRGLWPIIPMFLASYAVLMAIRGLWSGPYLAEVFELDTGERGNIILAMSIALGVGTFMLGVLDRWLQNTRRLVIVTSILTLVPLLLLAIFPSEGPYFAMWSFIAVGLFGFNYPLLMSHCRTFLAPSYHGRGMAFLTAMSFIGVALVQSISGWMMELANEVHMIPSEQYRLLFILLAGTLAVATLAYCFSDRQGHGNGPLS